MIRLSRTLAVFSIICCILFGGCSKKQAEAKKVSLTSSKNIWCTLPIIAKQRGFFNEEGLDVTMNYVQAAKLAMDALIAGSTEFATVVETNVAFLGFTGNTNINVISTVAEVYDGAIVARKSSGISNPADLKGKKIGILQGTTSQIFADKFLTKHGMDSKSVQVVNLQPVAIQTSLIGKEIDAGSIWQPFVFNIQKALGDDAVVFNDPSVYTGLMNIAVGKEWLAKNPSTGLAFLRALRKAEQFVANKPDSAQALMAKEINLDLDVVKSIWSEYSFQLHLDSNQLLKAIREEGAWIKSTQPGFADKVVPDYEVYVNSSLLSQVASTR